MQDFCFIRQSDSLEQDDTFFFFFAKFLFNVCDGKIPDQMFEIVFNFVVLIPCGVCPPQT